jgi:hypothetical protein
MDKIENIFRLSKILMSIKDKDQESKKQIMIKAINLIENNRDNFNSIKDEWIEKVKKEYSIL